MQDTVSLIGNCCEICWLEELMIIMLIRLAVARVSIFVVHIILCHFDCEAPSELYKCIRQVVLYKEYYSTITAVVIGLLLAKL